MTDTTTALLILGVCIPATYLFIRSDRRLDERLRLQHERELEEIRRSAVPRRVNKVDAGPQPGRKREPYTVDTTQHIGDQYAIVSIGGVVICRPTSEYAYLPERGAQLELETGACGRVTGLTDGEQWLFRTNDTGVVA